MKKENKTVRVRKRKKKRNKSRTPIKVVEQYVHFSATGNPEGRIGIEFGENGKISSPEAKKGSVNSYKSYMRDSGKEKRVVRSYTKDGAAYINQRDNIINNYDVLAGIDTNDYVINGKKVSIAFLYYSDSIKTDEIELRLLPAFVISEVKEGLNSELIGWHLFIKHILPLLKLENGLVLGLVVDSELDKHVAFNCREEAYYKDHYLPDNVGLIYASSDTGKDVPNKLIKSCDRGSRKLSEEIKNGELILPSQLGGGTNDYSGYAYVNFEDSEFKIEE